jgi:intracellular sulfur oxidation DsrE/DsrF family protein
MDSENYRLYVDGDQHYFATFEAAKKAAENYMNNKPELRIEILVETDGADFWAYEYDSKKWVPS